MTATFFAVRVGNVLRPDGAESANTLSKLPYGESLLVSIRRPRNLKRHKLYWVLCQRIADAIGAEAENVSDMLKIETGHCRIVKTRKFGVLRLPASISFHSMDETAFRDFFDRCLNVIYSEWGIERNDILAVVNDVLMPGMVT